MLEFTKYCVCECGMKYILPGKIKTDCLEARFGKYRQMAETQYHISMRQLLECEKKLRLQSCIKLQLLIKSEIIQLNNFDNCDELTTTESEESDLTFPPIIVNDDDIANAEHYLPVLAYLGGYCSHSVCKKLKCTKCRILF